MDEMIKLDIASSDHHFEQILDLQRRYHTEALAPEVQQEEGFVFAQHSVPLLRRMAEKLPQAIALADDAVVGYCLALPLSLRSELPMLAPMFDQFAWRLFHQNHPSCQLLVIHPKLIKIRAGWRENPGG